MSLSAFGRINILFLSSSLSPDPMISPRNPIACSRQVHSIWMLSLRLHCWLGQLHQPIEEHKKLAFSMSSWIYVQVFFYWSRHLSYGEIKMIQIFHHFARILNPKKSLPWQCGQILVCLLKVLQKAKKKNGKPKTFHGELTTNTLVNARPGRKLVGLLHQTDKSLKSASCYAFGFLKTLQGWKISRTSKTSNLRLFRTANWKSP